MKSRQIVLRKAFQYQSLLESYAYALLKDWSLSEDAVQEAFIAVSEKWSDLDEENLLPWLKTVTKRRSIDLIRKRKRIVQREDLMELVDSHFQNFMDESFLDMQKKYKASLQKCISSLRPDAIQAITGFYIDKKTTESLGQKMNRSANSVRILLMRSRQALRKCILRSSEAPS
ncbi:MAG: sigma-70 family RNA polymerase sigma factor [Lentisphaeraceae bacterium]|nr:sigma-70 family RNA polymerase sigma factor [Lentisphaeraceae bacterium]